MEESGTINAPCFSDLINQEYPVNNNNLKVVNMTDDGIENVEPLKKKKVYNTVLVYDIEEEGNDLNTNYDIGNPKRDSLEDVDEDVTSYKEKEEKIVFAKKKPKAKSARESKKKKKLNNAK